MKKIIFGLILLASFFVLFGCTQTQPASDSNKSGLNDINAQGISSNNNSDVSLKVKFCIDINYGWKCIIDKNAFIDENSWTATIDVLMSECNLPGAQGNGYGSESNYVYYCDLELPDAKKACNSSKDCIGSCVPTSDSNYSFDLGSDTKKSCPNCKGECSQNVVGRIEENVDWVVFDNGFLEHRTR